MSDPKSKPPLWSLKLGGFLLFIAMVFGALLALGLLPRRERVAAITKEAREEALEIPSVTVTKAEATPPVRELNLPGSVAAIGETPIYARAEGYIKIRKVDIGDRVKAGDMLVEIDSPELDQQIAAAKARLDQMKAALGQARASEQQAQAQLKLANVTRERVSRLVAEGVISKQEGDNSQALYEVRTADVAAAKAAISAAEQTIRAQESEIARLNELATFKRVTAPWDGIITVRNCAVGNLITPSAIAQGRELFRLADIRILRVFVNLPQANVPDVQAGQPAEVVIAGTSRAFPGKVSRLATAIDVNTRTQLTEVQVTNQGEALLPGMYVQVKLKGGAPRSVVIAPGDTLVTRTDGSFVATVADGARVDFRKVTIGRDLGTSVEILSGLNGGESLIVNPSDAVKDGVRVRPIPRK
jgi:RND family efflux transporter MFP subunit